MMRIKFFATLITLLASLLLAEGVCATMLPANVLLAQAVGISQDEAAARVRRQTGGRVLDVRTASQDGVTVYLVKVLLPNGRVRVVTVR